MTPTEWITLVGGLLAGGVLGRVLDFVWGIWFGARKEGAATKTLENQADVSRLEIIAKQTEQNSVAWGIIGTLQTQLVEKQTNFDDVIVKLTARIKVCEQNHVLKDDKIAHLEAIVQQAGLV